MQGSQSQSCTMEVEAGVKQFSLLCSSDRESNTGTDF